MAALQLRLRRYGSGEGLPLVLLHGLFGAGMNWHGIARRLERKHPVLVPDLRNHGDSPHAAQMTYPAIAADVAALLQREGIARAIVAGHSMGGKTAMWLALAHPERVEGVVVADMAPVRYPSGFETLVDALQTLPLADIADRADADRRLAEAIPEPAVRGYLLQNLRRRGDSWCWRFNLSGIAGAIPDLLDFPDPGQRQFSGPALFIYGTASSYVQARGLERIQTLFPLARLRALANAGHWVYADQPEAFASALEAFLARA
ncbi:MAG: alpha/beta fold hydrolase [Thiohalocapsa sp.]|nr:alpha/beta fold hydrolase [Thiohalocapsa sp.]MCF7988879.1 alpha/beta fold hydrolase [Thiohalocapsa sp.]